MHVAFIHPFMYRFRRGIERFIWNISDALSRQGTRVSILTWKDQHNYQLDALDPLVQVHAFGPFRYFAPQRAIPFYTFDLLKNSYDLVNICFADYGEAETLALATRLKKIRYNILCLYPPQQVPHRFRAFERSGLSRGADRLFAPSVYVADGVRNSLQRECKVIPHGVNSTKFFPNWEHHQQAKSTLGLDSDAPILLTICALERHKGIQKVIRALPYVMEQFPQLKYLVVGEGPYRGPLEALVTELHLERTVRFLGSQPEVILFLSAADIFLLLSDSNSEAFGIAVLEPMAMGLPVVVPSVLPFTEFVNPTCGALVSSESPREVAETIVELLTHPDQRHTMGLAARERILEKFTWDRVAEQYRAAFEEQLRPRKQSDHTI